jgi:hypothetical protein
MLNVNDLFPLFAALVGFPAFLAAVVNVLKYFGVLADGQAPDVIFWANIAGFAGVALAYFTGNLPLLNQIDLQLGGLATALLSFVAFISQLKLAAVYHAGLRGAPLIGTSFSAKG